MNNNNNNILSLTEHSEDNKDKRYTHISFLLDNSSSMYCVKEETIKNFNKFIQEQVKLNKENNLRCTFQLFAFDEKIILERLFNIENYSNDDWYLANGPSTALIDSIYESINSTKKFLEPLQQKPEKIIFVILTDGFENSSKFHTNNEIKDLIKNCRDNDKWEFIFLGAEEKIVEQGINYGVSKMSSMSYTSTSYGVENLYSTLNDSIASYRTDVSSTIKFTNCKIEGEE